MNETPNLVCDECGWDTEIEDFNPLTGDTLCQRCRGEWEPDPVSFEAAMAAKYPVKES